MMLPWITCMLARWLDRSFASWRASHRDTSPTKPSGRPISTVSVSALCGSRRTRCRSPPEGALWGSVHAHCFLHNAVVLSDDAGQFAVGRHALCWVHAERLVHKLDTFTDLHRTAQQRVRTLIGNFYDDLKVYQAKPTASRRFALRARFDRIFCRRTGFATLDRLLARLHANKAELLMVLERPEIPLHTNGSENDIRAHVTRRKVSAGTRSDLGRDCRDAFLG